MNNTLEEIICEAIQDDCVGHCNHPYCHQVNNVVAKLKENNIILPPCGIGDTVYYITGIHGRLVKPAKVDEIIYNGTDFTLSLVTDNNCYFDIASDRVHYTLEEAEKYIGGNDNESC